MNDLYEKCLKQVLKWEGGYVKDPDDKGGATNKGITQSTYNRWLLAQGKARKDVKFISEKEVKEIYYRNYWLASGCEKMTPKFAALCFDTAVNMGGGRVKEFLQVAQYKYPEKFIAARRAKYYEFSKYGNQKKFLNGWLNRLNDLEKFLTILS